MRVLVLGSGGREHAIIWKLRQDKCIENIFCLPGNGGTALISQNIPISLHDYGAILHVIKENDIDLTIVGSEGPLSDGFVDLFYLENKDSGRKIFGPTKAAAMLETSKLYARDIMKKYHIPHPYYIPCTQELEVIEAKNRIGLPLVIKDDGLASGKGVFVCETEEEYKEALSHFFKQSVSKKVSVEECLKGPELSVFIVCNGKNYVLLNNAQDYKRVYNQDKGPNTGGMGAYTPSTFYNDILDVKIKKRIIEPTLEALLSENIHYCGFLYFGLMLVNNEPYVIEYNARLGDPETQVILPMMKSSLLAVIMCTLDNNLQHLNYRNYKGYCTSVMLTSEGYPGVYQTGHKIHGLSESNLIFHSGTRIQENNMTTCGGRVLCVVGKGDTAELSKKYAYKQVNQIYFHKMYYRTDIGDITSKISSNIYEGKVRRVEQIGQDLLLLTTSNRLSAFNRHICDIPNKGRVLNKISEWWFNQTKHIIDNHFLCTYEQYMVVKKTEPIKIEFVVRGYMTGSTKTSIWPMYKSGCRDMYGIHFREGYNKNDKLDEIILTPTTKDEDDRPISKNEIIEEGYLTPEEYLFIEKTSIQLFQYGKDICENKGLLLVDTKYEFGRLNGNIILIDEIHTCDSSRYWLMEPFIENEPQKLDKDIIRDWLVRHCEPYNDNIPEIPSELINQLQIVYQKYSDIFS
jgi:phosphoribosylamine--glycine ligase